MALRHTTALVLFFTVFGFPQETKEERTSPYVERARKQFDFYPGGKIQIRIGVPGMLRILGWDRPSVVLDTEKVIYRLSPGDAKRLAQEISVVARWGQTSARIEVGSPTNTGVSFEANCTLHVPKEKTDLNIFLENGDMTIDTLNGWVEATLRQGNLDIRSVRGYFSLLTYQGDLNVQLSGNHWDGLGFTAATHQGSVSLQLQPNYSGSLNLATQNGNVGIDFPEQLVHGERVPLPVITNKNARSIVASIGDGGAPIRLYTAVGDVRLTSSPRP